MSSSEPIPAPASSSAPHEEPASSQATTLAQPEAGPVAPKAELAQAAAETPSNATVSPAITQSSPSTSISMQTTQNSDTPTLPERPALPEHESVNPTPPTAHLDQPPSPQDPQIAALQAIFPDFDGAVL